MLIWLSLALTQLCLFFPPVLTIVYPINECWFSTSCNRMTMVSIWQKKSYHPVERAVLGRCFFLFNMVIWHWTEVVSNLFCIALGFFGCNMYYWCAFEMQAKQVKHKLSLAKAEFAIWKHAEQLGLNVKMEKNINTRDVK